MFLVNNLTSVCPTVLATLYSNINYITNDEENKLPSGSLKTLYDSFHYTLIQKITVNSFFLENDNKTLPKEKKLKMKIR